MNQPAEDSPAGIAVAEAEADVMTEVANLSPSDVASTEVASTEVASREEKLPRELAAGPELPTVSAEESNGEVNSHAGISAEALQGDQENVLEQEEREVATAAVSKPVSGRVTEETEDQTFEEAAEAGGRMPAAEPNDPDAVRILMVDDRPENLIALEATLHELNREDPATGEAFQIELIRATSGNEALRHLLRNDFAVILLDVQMPGMDGYETAELIRQRPRSQHTPIIFLTAINTSETNVFRGYSLGAVDYLFKPYDPEVLRAKIGVFIELYRKSRAIQRMADDARAQARLLRASNDELGKTNKIMGGLYRELERKSQELGKERDLIDRVLESAGSYIFMFGMSGRIERVNRATEQACGYADEELLGQSLWTVVLERDRPLLEDAVRQLQAGESSVCADIHLRGREEIDARQVSMTFTPLRNDQGNVTSVVASGIDITERVEAEEQIRRMNEVLEKRVEVRTQELRSVNQNLEREIAERVKAELALKQAKEAAEEANSAKDQFLAVLSHELRTPLTPVLAIVQMLQEEPGITDELRGWIHTIQRNVQLEARLIDDLLDLTRISNGKLQLNIEKVEAHKLIHETIAICQEDIRTKCLTVELELAARRDDVLADPARLHQVLWNLIKNAVKFTPEGGSLWIRSCLTAEGCFQCSVQDTGIGIRPENLDRVFRAFDQGDSTITRRFGGLGLGLAISKALIDQHGGVIRAESEGQNRGSRFTIELPLTGFAAPAVEEAGDEQMTATAKAASRNGEDEAAVISAGRILLVEDNDDTSQVLRLLLERKGFTVHVAHTITDALEIAHRIPCDVLISDIGLPDGTGLDMIRRLNQIRPTRAIAMSGFGMDEDIQRSLDAGFQSHLVKPVNFDRLNEALQRLLTTAVRHA